MKHFACIVLLSTCLVLVGSQSCVDRCGDQDQSQTCQCNSVCSNFDDCCGDYQSVCLSCQERCGEAFLSSRPCHCNNECSENGNCCNDYSTICDGETDLEAEIISLTNRLHDLDESVGHLIVLDLTTNNPLFVSVDPSAFESRTMQAYLTLRDNYEADVCDEETSDAAEDAELVEFLDAVFETAVMKETEIFLADKGLVVGQTVREAIEESFFGFYSRCGSNLGSNGFEHSFMGEISDSSVSGYHNWISFYQDEQTETLILTDISVFVEISEKMSAMQMAFTWYNNDKEISSMYIGTTPELELAMYSVAFFSNPNIKVDVALNGYSHHIQTWDIDGTNFVGSAYPVLS